VYAGFELRDGILEHLGTCSVLAIRVLAIIWAIGSTAWAAHWADTIAFLKKVRGMCQKRAADNEEFEWLTILRRLCGSVWGTFV
jgi:hypothetical protein